MKTGFKYYRYKWSDDILKAIGNVLKGNDIKLYVEYMDTKRICDVKYLQMIGNIISLKHSKHTYDLIITSNINAFNFYKKDGV